MHSLPVEVIIHNGPLRQLNQGSCHAQVVALHDVSSTDAAIIYTMEPVLGAAFAYALLGERWGNLGWAGAGLIVISSLAAQILGTENPKKELPAPKER